MIETMKTLMLRGGAGWVMWLLVGLSVVSLAIAVERAWVVIRRGGDVGPLVLELNRLLRAGKLLDAQQLLAASKSVEATVAQAGLAEAARGPKAAEQSMAAARGVERTSLEERLGFLGTVGNNAPFIGLLGTVIGVVGAFEELGAAGMGSSALAPEKVMSAIAEALVATAMGLVVAIPAVAAFNYFQGRITRMIERSETLGCVVLAYLEGKDIELERVEPGRDVRPPKIAGASNDAAFAEEA